MSLRSLVCPLSLLLVAGARAQAPLSLDEALKSALARHPDVLAARQRVAQADARLAGARALPNPELDLGHGQSVTPPGAANTDQDVQLTQRFPIFGQRKSLTARAAAERETPRFELLLMEQDVAFRVRSAWYGVQSARATAEFSRQALEVAETFAQLADKQFKAGDVPLANVLRSQFEAESARQAVVGAETDLKNQSASLQTLLQLAPDAPVSVPELKEVVLKTFDRDALLGTIEAHPKVLSARAALTAQQAGIDVARSASRPELVAVYAHNQLQQWTGGNSYRVGVVLPLFDRGGIRASVRDAQAGVAEKEASLNSTRQLATLDLRTALNLHDQARELALRTGGEQLQRANRLYQLAETGYREGAASYLNVLDALGVLRAAYQSHLKALSDYNQAEAGLERALGGPLPTPARTESVRYAPPALTKKVSR